MFGADNEHGLDTSENPLLIQNINDICAVCLQQHKNHRTLRMQDTLSVQHKIEVYKVLESISLFKYSVPTSQLLCSTCSFKLLNIYEFQQMCNKSYFYLNNHINQKDTKDAYKLEIVDAADKETDIENEPFIDKDEDNNCLQEGVAKQNLIVISESSTFDNEVSGIEDSDAEDVCKIEIEDAKIHNLSSDNEGSIKRIQKSSTKFQASTSTELTFSEGTTKVCLESDIVRAGTIVGDGVTNKSTRIEHQASAPVELTEHGAHPREHHGLEKEESCIDARSGRISELVCKYCNRVLASKQSLIGHENLHSGKKPYKCDQCTRAFIRPQTLYRHKVSHNPVWPFVCNICAKTFKQRENLNLHMKGHVNARSHVCSMCGKAYNLKKVLVVHMRRKHNNGDNDESKINVKKP